MKNKNIKMTKQEFKEYIKPMYEEQIQDAQKAIDDYHILTELFGLNPKCPIDMGDYFVWNENIKRYEPSTEAILKKCIDECLNTEGITIID